MVKAVLIALMLLPLLGTAPWQASQPHPSAQHEREVDIGPHPGGVFEQPAGREHADAAADEPQSRHPETLSESDRAAQRARAIEKQDPALLPVCTDEKLINPPDPIPAKSFEPWDYPEQVGCHLPPPRPDQAILGPSSQPGPDLAGITADELKGKVH